MAASRSCQTFMYAFPSMRKVQRFPSVQLLTREPSWRWVGGNDGVFAEYQELTSP